MKQAKRKTKLKFQQNIDDAIILVACVVVIIAKVAL